MKRAPSIRRLLTDRRAVSALEYGIITGVLGLVLISIFTTFGGRLNALLQLLTSI